MIKLTKEQLQDMRKSFKDSKAHLIAQNAVMQNGIRKSAVNQGSESKHQFIFSDNVDSEDVANQRQSGRCWMFAALNTLRYRMKKKYALEDFELSQNYTFFYDKMEKCNYFYKNIIKNGDKSLDDRIMVFLLNTPQQDGGDWCWITDIIAKYGVVPKEAMGEVSSSMNSAELDAILNKKLRKDAIELRKLIAAKKTMEEVEEVKVSMLNEIYRILSIALGTPPETLRFQYEDKNGKYHSSDVLTPIEFYEDYIGLDLKEYVGIVNIPSKRLNMNTLYGVELDANMVDGRPSLYLNVEIDRMKELTIKQLQGGEPVWFACDVLKDSSVGFASDLDLGIMATDLYEIDNLLDVKFTMDKGERFDYRDSFPTHAMVIAGVNLIDGKPDNWKVENSWGASKRPNKGYLVMSDEWFTEYNYEVVINKKYLNQEEIELFNGEATMLPFWSTL